jgi:hypothetical protein
LHCQKCKWTTMGKSQKRFGDIWSWTKLIEVVRFDFFLKGGVTPFGRKEISCETKCSCWE